MKVETVLNVHYVSLSSLMFENEKLAALIRETFAIATPIYSAVHVYAGECKLTFQRERHADVSAQYVGEEIGNATYYEMRDMASKLSAGRISSRV